jgi:hypothetical protein
VQLIYNNKKEKFNVNKHYRSEGDEEYFCTNLVILSSIHFSPFIRKYSGLCLLLAGL